MAASFAICTLLTNDAYLPGAIALAAALRDLHPKPAQAPEVDFQSVCIVTPETVDVSSIKLLRRTFDLVVGVEILEQDDDSNLRLLGEWYTTRSTCPPTPNYTANASLTVSYPRIVVGRSPKATHHLL